MKSFRDLIILDDMNLLLACDSAAGIGEKPCDEVFADIEMVSYYAAFVPIAELLCVKASQWSWSTRFVTRESPMARKSFAASKWR